MSIFTLFIFAISLSFDTFAVSITTGFISNSIKFWQATKIALVLAFVQGLMPLLGWLIGISLKDLISVCDHWIAFALLSAIGIKMIYDSVTQEEEQKNFNPFNPVMLIGIAVATSIDAFVVGISFALVEVKILISITIIFVVTYIVAMLGMLFGKTAGKYFGKKIEILGGITLICLGLNILIKHLYEV